MSAGTASGQAQLGTVESDPRRWQALIVLALIQFIQVLDVTVVNVALPSIQRDLNFSQSGLPWIVNSYVIMAGGLLLLGGRLADLYGRRRLFLIGVAVFAVASTLCGAAASAGMLVSSRFAQGVGEALAAPAALGLIALLFPDGAERMKALGIFGGVAGIAGVTGVVISGVLTDLASWRWIFFINIPVALVALIMVPRLVTESRMKRGGGRVDFTGAITATAGITAIVFGLLQAATHSLGAWQVWLPVIGGLALIALMILIESRSAEPLIPLRFFTNRTRVVANVVGLLFLASFISYFFLMTLFEQQVLEFSPLKGGLAYLPVGLSMGVGVGLGAGLMAKVGVKPMMTIGFFGVAIALFLTSFIHADSSYASGVLPGMIIFGLSSGLAVPSIGNAALHEVTGQDAGLASGVQQAVQQIGAALGLALLVTLALRDTATQIGLGTAPDVAAAHGFGWGFRVSSILVAIAGVLTVLLLEKVSSVPRSAVAEMDVRPATS